MKWAEFTILTSQEALEAVSNILHEAGAGGVIVEDQEEIEKNWTKLYENTDLPYDEFPEEGVYLISYFPMNSYLMETIEQIKQEIISLENYNVNIGKGSFNISEKDEEEWSTQWKKYYKPVKITDNITITPIWEKVEENEKQIVIHLDPGMAFGTGTHPTTVLSIKALEKEVKQGDTLIDVGCGTGVLSIAAANLGAKDILALDVDQVAVDIAKSNVEINNCSDLVEVKQNNLLQDIQREADVIVANILADVIIKLTRDVARVLKQEGVFIASGIIEAKEELVREAIEGSGLTIIETLYQEDWLAIIAKKS